MPVPRKVGVGRASRWTDEHRAALIGHDFFNAFSDFRTGPFRDHPGMAVDYRLREDEAERMHNRRREAWNDLRDELLPIWIAEKPFSRPDPWWVCDAPELRRCLDGVHPFERPEFIAHCEEYERKWPGYTKRTTKTWYGEPSTSGAPGLPHGMHFESERDFLIRLNLLTDLERELLAYEQITTASPSATANAEIN